MNETPLNPDARDQTAVHCYLSTILATAECLVRLCPDLGIPYQNRWRRLPQRIGFDPSSQSIERSEHMFRSDLERFSEWAGKYFNDGVNVVRNIGTEGGQSFERAIEETESHAALLDTLANSLEEAADLDAPMEVRDALGLQSEGLRKAARQMRNRLLPSLLGLADLVRECRRVVKQTEQDAILDATTGFLNGRGFRYELKSRYEASKHCCVLLIECAATFANGQPCTDSDYRIIAADLAERIGDQFRPWDCAGRIGPSRFGVIFEADFSVAKDRVNQIARSITGTYSGGISVRATIEVMEASDTDALLTILNAIDQLALAA
ncbi:MAG TPA: GGDEF domain-containing protein [Bryobacteraceae bacterium]|nr:GGDEF domain-containing protein [Bryobacteraceae bacterium]